VGSRLRIATRRRKDDGDISEVWNEERETGEKQLLIPR